MSARLGRVNALFNAHCSRTVYAANSDVNNVKKMSKDVKRSCCNAERGVLIY